MCSGYREEALNLPDCCSDQGGLPGGGDIETDQLYSKGHGRLGRWLSQGIEWWTGVQGVWGQVEGLSVVWL